MFLSYMKLFSKTSKILPIIYQNKTKTPGKIGIAWFNYQK